MKKTVLLATALAVLICAASVWSQVPPDPNRPGRPGGQRRPGGAGRMGGGMMSCPAMAVMTPQAAMIDRAAEPLQLTEEQATQLKDVLTKGDQTVRTLSQKAADSSKAVRDALLASEYDADKVKALAATAEKAETAVINARIDVWTQMRSILTAEQTKALQDMMSMQRQGPGMGQRPAGPPPGGPGLPPPPGGDGPAPPPPAPE